jgi:uncharacterized protein (TIGR02117 family)
MVRKTSVSFKVLYFLKASILFFTTLIVLYFVIALLFSFLPTHPPERNCIRDKTIYVNTNGVHVDIIIPAGYLQQQFKNQLEILPATQFVAFGWGDRNFYIHTPEWSDLTLPVAFKALFLKSSTAMHVTFYPHSLNSWASLQLCDNQLEALIAYIENTFKKDKKGMLIKMDFEGYNDYDSFFEARGSFSLFRTCNVWVNQAFKKAEIKTAVWTPFDFGVLFHVK